MAKLKKLMLLCAAFALTASMGLVTACGGGDNSSSSSAGSSDSASASDSASTDDSTSVDDSASDDSSSDDSEEVVEGNFVAVEGYSFEDMTTVTANSGWGVRTDVTVNLPSAGKYVVFSDDEFTQFGENNDEGDYTYTYTFEVADAGAYTFDAIYYNYMDDSVVTGEVPVYVYKINEIELSMDGGEEDLLGYNVKNTVKFTVPTAGKYVVAFDTEVEIYDEFGGSILCTKFAFETPTDNFTITCDVLVTAVANQEYATVGYSFSEILEQNLIVGDNTIDVTSGYDNPLTFTTETAGEYKLVCDNESVSFGLYDAEYGFISYWSMGTYYDNNVAKEALIFTAEANVPFTIYAKADVDVADVSFNISPLTADEKYPTEITVDTENFAEAAVPANGSVDVVLDGAVAGTTYVMNWSTDDSDLVFKLGNVEFDNGSVFFVYTEDMSIQLVNKNATDDASASDVDYQPAQYAQPNNDKTFDVYMSGDNVSSPELVFNVTRDMVAATYQLTWNSTVYTVGTRLNNTTDGATGLTFENISAMNPIMTAVAPSATEGAIRFTATEKVEPPTTISVGSNMVAIGASGTTNVQLSTAAAGKYVIMEVTDGDFLAPGMMGSMAPVQFPFVFETYDNGDGTFTSQIYQVGSMNNELTFVIYEVTDLAEGTNEVAVPAGETVYACYSNIADSSIWTSTVALASGETTAKVEVYVLNNLTDTYEWVEVTDSLEFATDYFMNVLFRITSSATDADTADFTITPVVSE